MRKPAGPVNPGVGSSGTEIGPIDVGPAETDEQKHSPPSQLLVRSVTCGRRFDSEFNGILRSEFPHDVLDRKSVV